MLKVSKLISEINNKKIVIVYLFFKLLKIKILNIKINKKLNLNAVKNFLLFITFNYILLISTVSPDSFSKTTSELPILSIKPKQVKFSICGNTDTSRVE